MKRSFFKVSLFIVLISLCAAALGGCLFMDPFGIYGDCDYFSARDERESVTEGYFKLTINTSKNEFAKGEAIDCWAKLEYIGEGDGITVYTCGQPLTMSMTGKGVYYDSSPDSFSQQKELTLKKGVPMRLTLSGLLPKSKSFLPGQYEIDASANLSLTPDGNVSYNGFVSAVIVVKE